MGRFLILFLSLSFFNGEAQVGIGVVNPTASLEIKTDPDGLPGLQLNKQNNPSGNSNGQIAVIDDRLFAFNALRGKWLSIEETILEFGRLGSGSEADEVEFGGGDLQNGPILPFDGTITAVSLSATKDDNMIDIILLLNGVAITNNDANPTIDGVFNLDPTTLAYQISTYNQDFQAGDMINFEVDSSLGLIDNLVITLHIKWRRENP